VRDLEERFVSKVLPLFKRRTQAVGELLPELNLHGLSTGDFELALRGLLSAGAPLSASSIQRLKARFEVEHEQWKERDLSQLEVVYAWAGGLYVKAGISDRKAALLVIVGALSSGEKGLLACESGQRESSLAAAGCASAAPAIGPPAPALIADSALVSRIQECFIFRNTSAPAKLVGRTMVPSCVDSHSIRAPVPAAVARVWRRALRAAQAVRSGFRRPLTRVP
jgi:hypothetical protein